ncbi:MAG: hypothetical protein LBR70_00960 [Lactobacillaceae bacterium]|jgi:hypothetical protein|nr:hypothetical protein [Lactobacillaceae bacterium]
MAKSKENKEAAEIIKADVAEPKTQPKKFSRFLKKVWNFIFGLFVITVLLATVFIVIQHPEIKEYYEEVITGKNRQEVIRLTEELESLKKAVGYNTSSRVMVSEINESLLALKERYDVLEENNLNTIRSKADVSLVLGMIGRLDNIENKVNEAAKVSDRGALIAMATGLVKEAWERGGDFTYEMSVLDQITREETRIRPYIEVLNKHSEGIVYNETLLTGDFEKIYNMYFLQDDEEITDDSDWRAKFNKKFGKLLTIKIRRTPEEKEEVNLDKTLSLIKEGEFNKAVEELNKGKYADIVKDNSELKDWLHQANARVEFVSALSKVSAYSLAVMKVNEFQK